MDLTSEVSRAVIRFENIPSHLQQLPNWALYTDRKVPVKLSAVARGWPQQGWNHGLTGEDAKAGARSNDPRTWGTFDACYKCWQLAQERGHKPIVGPSFALQEELGITVIDMDDPVAKAGQKNWVSEDAKVRGIQAALENQQITLGMFRGHYIEWSISGRGFHIFVLGRMPAMRYKFSFYGSVFGCCQFINMTGDLM